MTNFIRDNTPLYDDKTDAPGRPLGDRTQQWWGEDGQLVKNALLDTQSYLRGGRLDASVATTVVGGLALVSTVPGPTVAPETQHNLYNTAWYHGGDVANSPTSRDFVMCGSRRDYSLNDGAITSGSPTLTSASEGGFVAAQIGASISGAGIPNGTTIIAVGGTTSLTMSANATATATNVRVTITTGQSFDLAYWKHRGGLVPTLGIGVLPPDGTHRLQVSGQDDEPAMGALLLRRSPSQTGHVMTVRESGGTDRLWIDNDFVVSGANAAFGGALVVQADATNARALLLTDNAKGSVYGFTYPGGNTLRLRYVTGALDIVDFTSGGAVSFLRSVRHTNELAPAALGADQNDYSPANLADAYDLFLSASVANVNITGIATPANGRELYVYNSGGSNTITLKHQNASSAAANRIIGRSNADVVLNPAQGVLLRYSTSLARWVVRHAP